jgi:hypothetical protein
MEDIINPLCFGKIDLICNVRDFGIYSTLKGLYYLSNSLGVPSICFRLVSFNHTVLMF